MRLARRANRVRYVERDQAAAAARPGHPRRDGDKNSETTLSESNLVSRTNQLSYVHELTLAVAASRAPHVQQEIGRTGEKSCLSRKGQGGG